MKSLLGGKVCDWSRGFPRTLVATDHAFTMEKKSIYQAESGKSKILSKPDWSFVGRQIATKVRPSPFTSTKRPQAAQDGESQRVPEKRNKVIVNVTSWVQQNTVPAVAVDKLSPIYLVWVKIISK